MSDLQLSLLIIGAVVVGAVYLFNWLQERKFRRKVGQAFEVEHEDVLLGGTRIGGRVEPQVTWSDGKAAPELPEPVTEEPGTATAPAGGDSSPATPYDPDLDYVAVIESELPISETVIAQLVDRVAACGKPCRFAGLRARGGEWEELSRAAGDHYVKVAAALQLANRAGPVTAAQLAMFCDAVRNSAAKASAVARCADSQPAIERAQEIDRFRADVDVAFGVNVVAEEGQSFPGSRIRALAETAGFKLEPDGLFHFRNEQRHVQFTLDNHEPAPFLPEQINRLSTSGITLLLDVPRVGDGLAALDRMLEVGRELARALGGRLVDDNRVALNERGIAWMRQQLAETCARMQAAGYSAGGARALRLFS